MLLVTLYCRRGTFAQYNHLKYFNCYTFDSKVQSLRLEKAREVKRKKEVVVGVC